MSDIGIVLTVLAAWVVFNVWVLPKMGVKT